MKRNLRSWLALPGIILMSVPCLTHGQSQLHSSQSKEEIMKAAAHNKEMVRHMYEDILNTGRLDLMAEVIGKEYTGNTGEKGPEDVAATVRPVIAGFPDIKWTIEEMVADGDNVVVKWHWDGTHTGDFQGWAPTGKKVHHTAMVLYRFAGGKIVSAYMQSDRLGFLQQIGVADKGLGTPPKSKK